VFRIIVYAIYHKKHLRFPCICSNKRDIIAYHNR